MVSGIISKGKDFLFKKEENILRAGFIIGASLIASAFLGLLRDRLFSQFFGAEPYFSQLGLYFAADRVPSFVFNIIVVGTLTTAFIPVFTKYLRKNANEIWNFASNALNSVLVVFAVLATLIFAFAYPLSKVISLNTLGSTDLNFMSSLLRIMMFAQLILVLSSFYTSIFQSLKRFLVPSLAPVLYNLGIIAFTLLFAKKMGVFAPAWGMVFGALMHFVTQALLSRDLGFRYSRILNFRDKGLVEMFALMLPRTVSLAANQISLLIDTSLSILIGASSLVIFNFAQHLQTVPVNFFGGAISQAAFPVLSTLSDDKKEFSSVLKNTTKQIAFFVLPVSMLFIILRIPLVRLVFGASKFSWDATIGTSYTLAFFSISIVFQSLVYLFNKAFYSLCDTKTPVKISLISIAINIVLAAVFIVGLGFGIWSLSFAFSISSFINFVILFVVVGRTIPDLFDVGFLASLSKIGWASIFTAVCLYIPMKIMDKVVFDTTKTLHLIILTGTAFLIGFFSYILFSKFLDIKEREVVLNVIKRFIKKGPQSAPSNFMSGETGVNVS